MASLGAAGFRARLWMTSLIVVCQSILPVAFAENNEAPECPVFQSADEDSQRLTQFYSALEPQLAKFQVRALKLTGNPTEAEDLFQRTIERAVKRVHQFEPGSNLGGWLHTIMFSIYANDLQAAKSLAKYGRTVPLDETIHVASVPANQLGAIELKEVLQKIELLPEAQQKVLHLIMNGMNSEEIATQLNVPKGTVRARLSRARAKLNELLGPSKEGTSIRNK